MYFENLNRQYPKTKNLEFNPSVSQAHNNFVIFVKIVYRLQMCVGVVNNELKNLSD